MRVNMKSVFLVAAIAVGTTIIIQVLPVGLGYVPIALVCLGVLCVFSNEIDKLNKTIAEQQRQIDEMKRELEEVKGKE